MGYFDSEDIASSRHFENFISVNFFGTDGGIFYHPYKASVEMKVHTLKFSKFHSFNEYIGNFVTCVLKPTLKGFDYGNQLSSSKLKNMDFKIYLPKKDNLIDFSFINQFTSKVFEDRLETIESYLTDNDMNHTDLTNDERNALNKLKSIDFKEFKVTAIFTIKNTGNILSSWIKENSGTTPYLCASAANNSVSSYIQYDEDYLDNGNCVFIGGKTFVVTYQKDDFFSNDSHNLTLKLKEEEHRNKICQLFLATCVKNSLGHKYSWGDSISSSKIKKDSISLPVKDDQPDYEFMENYISAIQKLTVKKLISYLTEKKSKLAS